MSPSSWRRGRDTDPRVAEHADGWATARLLSRPLLSFIEESDPSELEHARRVAVVAVKEWYDGQGYPQALVGDAIPLGGRIIAVADAFDSMTRTQLYRDAIPSSGAVQELLRCSNSQFDPVVVSTLLEVLGEASAKH